MERLREYTRTISSLPKGTAFARYAIAKARARNGDLSEAFVIANSADWNTTPQVRQVLRAEMAGLALEPTVRRAAVAPGDTIDAQWANPLVQYQTMVGEFVELLRPATILGRMLGIRRVPFNIRFPAQTAGALVGWVGQNAPAAVAEMGFEEDTLGFARVSGIVGFTLELMRSSAPAVEGLVRRDLVASIAGFLDQQLVDPGIGAVADVSPASITHGATSIPSSGSTVSAIIADLEALFAALLNAGINMIAPVLIMRPSTLLALAMKRTTDGAPAFPTLSVAGPPSLFGVPIISSANVPGSTSAGSIIVLVDSSEILLADDGACTLDTSTEASLQLDNAPAGGAQTLVNLFQSNLAAVRCVRWATWKRRRDAAVAYLEGVAY